MTTRTESEADVPAMVGREEEQAILRQSIDSARAGRGCVVVVAGPPGSGKTRLVQDAAAMARRLGMRVMWLPASGEGIPSVVDAALKDAGGGRPVVIIDDGPATAAGPSAPFTSTTGDLSAIPVLALETRSTRPGSEPSGRSEPGHDASMTIVRIRPLRCSAVITLAARMGVGTSIPLLERLHAASGGNALLVVETLAALRHAVPTVEQDRWPLSDRVVHWMQSHLRTLPRAAVEALEVASVLGADCDVALVALMLGAGLEPARVRTELDQTSFTVSMEDDARCRFVPPLVRDLVYASLAAERRAALHTRAAAALAAAGASAAALAHEALAALADGDVRRCEHRLHRLVHQAAAAPGTPWRWPYFVREDEHWAIGYGRRAVRLSHRMGLLYLARLLSQPGVELTARELGAGPERAGGPTAARTPQVAAERARIRVTRRIRDGIARIAGAHPELGVHLEETIRTGGRCRYAVDPATAPRWEIRSSPLRSGPGGD